MSKEMKEMDGKKKKPDEYDPLPTANIQNYYRHVGVVNSGNDVVNIVQKEKKKVEKVPITETFQDTVTISRCEMKVLVKVSESVGMFYGPRSTGTCWRVGKDKVLTAAHVVKDNIWSNFHEFLNEEKYKDCYVDFDYNGQQKKDTDSKHFVFEIERTEYISETLDVAVVKLKREIHKDFPPPLEFFDILDPEKNDNEHIYLIGHDKGGELQTNYGIGLWNPTEKRLNDLEKFCQEYGKENGYKELDRKDRLVIQCKFVSGASGCPGVVIHGDKASVVLIYTRGFPDFYYSKNFPEKDKQEFPKERLLQQGVNIGPVFKSMTKNKMYLNLRNEIFPHQASEEQQQLNGQHQYAVDGANKSINTTNPESTFKIVKDLEDHITVRQDIENNTAKWTICTEGHSKTAVPYSAKYNRQPSYALAIDDGVDIAYPNMKPPADDTDIILPHGHSQNIPVHRNEQNITQDIKTDGSDQSHDQKDEKGGDASDNKKDESGHSNLSGCDQNGTVKSNGSETGNHNSGQTNDTDSVPPESAPSDGDKSNQQKTGEGEFAFPISNEFKKDDKGKKDQKEVVKSKTKKKKDRTDKYVLQPGTIVQHHEYHEKIDILNIGCDNVVVKHEKIEEKRETTATTIHSVETMNILSDVAKSVGHIIGPKESGTCWRVGYDKIITAAHVVVGHQLIGSFLERDLDRFRVDFEYINKESSSHDQFKVVPRVLYMDESLDVAVLQLKPDEKKPFPPPLKMFHVLNLEKDDDKQIYLISHNQSKKKEVNSGIGIWKPTEKKLQDLEKFCQQYGEENGYLGLERKDRLVIQCDFVGGASGSPGIVILNSVAYVILVYIRGFPSFYHSQKFSKEQRRKFPTDNLFQHGVNIESLFVAMSNGVDNILLRNEIFPEEALKLEQTINQHKLAISGDKTSSNTETTETSTDIVKDKMDNISAKSETKITISKGTACTDQSEDNIPDAANYNRLMSHNSVPGQTYITSPQEDTDRYNNTSTGNQSAQDIKTGGSDICTVQDQGSHSHSSTGNAAAENHNLHAKDGEMITLQRSPGRTRLVSAGQISIDEWIGNEWQNHRYKQLQDKDLLLLSKAIHSECVNSVAIHFNMNQMDVEEIQTGQQTDLCCQILYKWKIKNGEEATLGKLIQNLFSSWISENKSVEKEVLKSAISQVTMVNNEEAAS